MPHRPASVLAASALAIPVILAGSPASVGTPTAPVRAASSPSTGLSTSTSTSTSLSAAAPVAGTMRSIDLLPAGAAAAGDASLLRPAEAGAARHQAAEAGLGAFTARVQQVSPPVALGTSLAVVGLTWQRGTGTASIAQYRTRTAATTTTATTTGTTTATTTAAATTWSAWREVEINSDEGPDPASAEARNARDGSDALVLTGVQSVQVRLLGAAGAQPAGTQLRIIDPQAGAAVASAATTTPTTLSSGAPSAINDSAIVARPPVLARSVWGADESLRQSPPAYASVKGAVVHHTQGTNAYTKAQVPAILRGIYVFHVKGRGWNDIAYNVLVDKWGRVWEGRAGGVQYAVQGAHVKDHNSYVMGVSLLGDFRFVRPTAAAIESISRVIAWKAGLHEFAPAGAVNLYGRRYLAISGHGDIGQTDCPGTYLRAALPAIRKRATKILGYDPALTLRRDLDHKMGSDVVGVNGLGSIVLTSATGTGTLGRLRTIATWRGITAALIPGDLTNDGAVDLVTRTTSGVLRLHPGNGQGGFGRAVFLGNGWARMTRLVGPGDLTGDGRPDLLAVDSAGRMRLYAGRAGGLLAAPRALTGSWSGLAQLAAVGDWDANGSKDLIAVSASGRAVLHRYTGTGFVASTTLAGDWRDRGGLTGISDTNRDGRTELYWIDGAGESWLGRRTGATGVTAVSAGLGRNAMRPFGG